MDGNKKSSTRKRNRLNNYDYSNAGAYFLTVCTLKRHNYFWTGELDFKKLCWTSDEARCVRPEGLPLSNVGRIVLEELNKWHTTYENILLRSFVIMPDHIHLIVEILSEVQDSPNSLERKRTVVPTVGRMVKQFKGAVTKRIGFSIWQTSFFDHIIRNPKDYGECTKYIVNNPSRYYYGNLDLKEETQ